MRELFKYVFERITDPLSLPIPWYWDYIIISIIGFIAYKVAFRSVGKLYDNNELNTKTGGRIVHWTIRLVVFVLIWFLVYAVIEITKFFIRNWLLIFGMLIALLIVLIAVREYMKIEKKEKAIH